MRRVAGGRQAAISLGRMAIVTPGYTRAIGLPLLRGRMFDERDKPVWGERGQPPPERRVVISDRLAKLIFPNEEPSATRCPVEGPGRHGRRSHRSGGRQPGARPANDPTLTVYLPYGENVVAFGVCGHTSGNPMALDADVRSIVAEWIPTCRSEMCGRSRKWSTARSRRSDSIRFCSPF